MGTAGPPQAALSGNHVGVGDLIRARLNTKIVTGGRQLTNPDILAIAAFRGPDAEVRRQRPDGTWTGTFRVPRSYLARHAELAYVGNVHVAQGRTVDTAHLLVTDSLSRQDRGRSPTTNLRRRPDGGASSKPTSRPSTAPSPASTGPPSTPETPGHRNAHLSRTRRPGASRMPGRHRSPARGLSPRRRRPRKMTARRGWTNCSRGPARPRSVSGAQKAERQAGREYAARLERGAQGYREAGRQAEAREQAELEM